MRLKVVNFTQELVAGFARIKWQLSQELMAGLIKNIQGEIWVFKNNYFNQFEYFNNVHYLIK